MHSLMWKIRFMDQPGAILDAGFGWVTMRNPGSPCA